MKKFKRIFIMGLILSAVLGLFTACGPKLSAPSGISVDVDNKLTWDAVAKASNYEIEIRTTDGADLIAVTDGENVNTYSFTSRRTIVDLSNSAKFKLNEGDYAVKIKALGKTQSANDSEWSSDYEFHKEYETGCVYVLINNNTEYEISKVGNAEGSIVIEDMYRGKPVTSIGDGAFKGSKRVENIVLGKNITRIGKNAFYNATNLKSIVIPEGVEEIDESAFKACTALVEVEIPSTVRKIGDSAFLRCKSLTSVIIGEGVEEIGESAFSDCFALKEITIPDSVKVLGEYAFSTGNMLEKAVIGSGLESIPAYAFSHCPFLKTVEFKDNSSLVQLQENAFSDCLALESIKIPEGVVSVGNSCFTNCAALKEVDLPSTLRNLGAFAFRGTALYEASGDIVYVENWIADYKAPLRDIQNLDYENIKEGTYGIADAAFYNSLSLVSVVLPASVKVIGKQSFYGCQSLMTLNTHSVELIDYGAFCNCVNLTTLKLGEGLREIGAYAFMNCSSLDNNKLNPTATLPDSVRKIGAYAFKDTALWKTAEGVVYAGKWVVGCNEFPALNSPLPLGGVTSADLTVDDEPCVGISDYAFFYQINLKTVNGLENIMYMGKGAFYNCMSLASVSLCEDLMEIPDYAFARCSSLFKVTLPGRVKSIGKSAFYLCKKLSGVEIPNSVETMGANAFNSCYNLTDVKLSNKLADIPDFAFFDCAMLQSVEIPDSVKSIGEKSFGRCMTLENVDLGEGVQTIGYAAFYKNILLGKITLPDSVVSVDNHAFYNCWALSEVNFGNSVQFIGDYAFYWTSMQAVNIPSSVKSIGRYSFAKNSFAGSVTLPSTTEKIGANAFYADENATVYTDADSDNALWNALWNSSSRPVVYGCELSEEGYVSSVTVTENTFKNVYVIKVADKGDDENTESGKSASNKEQDSDKSDILYNQISNIKGPSRAGYVFIGWAVEKDSKVVAYDETGIVNAPSGTTLYAIWEKVEEETPDPPYEPSAADDNETVEYGVNYHEEIPFPFYEII